MRHIYFKFSKSFLREQGITKEDIEKGLAILTRDLRKMSKELRKSYCIEDEEENKNIAKAFSLAEIKLNKAFSPGTIRTWKGKKFIKGADKKWRPYFEKKTHVTNTVGAGPEKTEIKEGTTAYYYNEAIKAALSGGGTKQEKILRLTRERNNQIRENNRLIGSDYDAAKEHSRAASLLTDYINKVKSGKVEVDSALEEIGKKTVEKPKTQGKTTKKKTTKRKTKSKTQTKKTETKGKTEKTKTEEKKTETKIEPKKEDTKEKKESEKSIDIDFENVFPAILSGKDQTINGITFSRGRNFERRFSWNKEEDKKMAGDTYFDSYGFSRIILQFLKKGRYSDDERLIACEAWLELAVEAATKGENNKAKETEKRKYYEKDGMTVTVEKSLGDKWQLKRLDIDKDRAEKAIQKRIDYIKNTPSRKKVLDDLQKVYKDVETKCFNWHGLEPYKTYSDLYNAGVKCVIPKKLKTPLSDSEIAEKLSFYNKNGGYCVSLALLYIAAKNGFDVLDKKGENSRKYFGNYPYEILGGVLDADLVSECRCETFAENAKLLFDTIKEKDYGKEYLFIAGQHASIIKKDKENGKLMFLELQDNEYGWGRMAGWDYDSIDKCLEKRFGCTWADKNFQVSHHTAFMFNIDEISEKLKDEEYYNDFTHLLGYLNTKK